ncbi:hypothetical protein C8R45DRAFT_1164668 [Mycena sanguinolenta]|nr:hypothetical protein C8R45DRAFT_1164668 [Mycena sanguinolenta]
MDARSLSLVAQALRHTRLTRPAAIRVHSAWITARRHNNGLAIHTTLMWPAILVPPSLSTVFVALDSFRSRTSTHRTPLPERLRRCTYASAALPALAVSRFALETTMKPLRDLNACRVPAPSSSRGAPSPDKRHHLLPFSRRRPREFSSRSEEIGLNAARIHTSFFCSPSSVAMSESDSFDLRRRARLLRGCGSACARHAAGGVAVTQRVLALALSLFTIAYYMRFCRGGELTVSSTAHSLHRVVSASTAGFTHPALHSLVSALPYIPLLSSAFVPHQCAVDGRLTGAYHQTFDSSALALELLPVLHVLTIELASVHGIGYLPPDQRAGIGRGSGYGSILMSEAQPVEDN